MLTFDLDAETLWLEGDLANLKKPGLISQGTYGQNVAVPLILDQLKRRGLPATFFIPSWTIDNHPTAARAVIGGPAIRTLERYFARQIYSAVGFVLVQPGFHDGDFRGLRGGDASGQPPHPGHICAERHEQTMVTVPASSESGT
jgi:peptidoglycan/xylan/chitin deacetylase (PgdA/CDA1 family)